MRFFAKTLSLTLLSASVGFLLSAEAARNNLQTSSADTVSSYAAAADLLEKECLDSGDPVACKGAVNFMLNHSYRVAPERGFILAKKLCNELNDGFSCMMLSVEYIVPNGVVKSDPVTALKYAEKACSLNDMTGCSQAGMLLYAEAFEMKDTDKAEKAFDMFARSCALGNQTDCDKTKERDRKLLEFSRYSENTAG